MDYLHKITAGDSGGSLTVEEWVLPPCYDPLRTHARKDECNFVLEGELTSEVGGDTAVAQASS